MTNSENSRDATRKVQRAVHWRRLRRRLAIGAVVALGLWAFASPVSRWSLDHAAEPPAAGSTVVSNIALGTSNAPSAESDDAPRLISVTRPQPGGIRRSIIQTGTLVAAETAKVFPRVSGYLSEVAIDIGDWVQAGDTLAMIDVPDLIQDLRGAEARVEKARSEVKQARARLQVTQSDEQTHQAMLEEAESEIERFAAQRRLREKEVARLQGLVQRGALSETRYDEKVSELEQASAAERHARKAAAVAQAKLASLVPKVELERANIATAEASLSIAEADVQRAQLLVNFSRIAAPFSGVVTDRNCDLGDYVRPASSGSDRPLFTIANTSSMKVVVSIPDRMVPYIRAGDEATVRIDSLHADKFQGEVSRVSMRQDRQTRSMRAEIDLPNPDGLLVDGMYGSVTIVSAPPQRGLTIPLESLFSSIQEGLSDLWVVRDDKLKRVRARIGQTKDDRVEVYSGLTAEDQVVFAPTANLVEGSVAGQVVCKPWNEELATALPSGNR